MVSHNSLIIELAMIIYFLCVNARVEIEVFAEPDREILKKERSPSRCMARHLSAIALTLYQTSVHRMESEADLDPRPRSLFPLFLRFFPPESDLSTGENVFFPGVCGHVDNSNESKYAIPWSRRSLKLIVIDRLFFETRF